MQTIYNALNQTVLSLVPPSAKRILDVGCGTGVFGEALRQEKGRYVAGITYSSQEAEMARTRLSDVYCADLEEFDFSTVGMFDCVILSHVLEHLRSPSDLLGQLKNILEPQATIVVALPNVMWWKQRMQFVLGRWRYQEWGILDRTHFRFFDRSSSVALLEDSGFEILKTAYDGPFPLTPRFRRLMGSHAGQLDRLASKLRPGWFAMQFVYLARVKK